MGVLGVVRRWTRGQRTVIPGFLLAVASATSSEAAPDTTPGALRSYATIQSVGVEWDVSGDDNHNAVVRVQYREAGSASWRPALDLVRVDFNGYNMLAGSALFLAPGTPYELRLDLSDVDGGADGRTVTIATRALPVVPVGGGTFHVVPGTSGGDGSSGNPFRGIATAEAQAQPRDVFLIHAGNYGSGVGLSRSGGSGGQYIVWRGAGDGEATFYGFQVSASHVWVEGITVRDQADGLTVSGSPTDNVVSRCFFYNNHKAIVLSSGSTSWYIADNTIVGDNDPLSGSFSGEGVLLNHSDGHSVAYNRISRTADGISYAGSNVDIFGNDISNTSDDGIEPDYGYTNIRIWGNRVHFPLHNGITFQPMNSAPWYIIRNQVIISTSEGPLKLKPGLDRFLLFHNTLVNVMPGEFQNNADLMLNAFARNNLFVAGSSSGSQVWHHGGTPTTWETDLDNDGFDWGPFSGDPFVYLNTGYSDLPSYAAASGQEQQGIRIAKESCFTTLDFTGAAPLLNLKVGCNAVDAGTVLPNINDGYIGSAPDLGAYELGAAPPQYGPRQISADIVNPSAITDVRPR